MYIGLQFFCDITFMFFSVRRPNAFIFVHFTGDYMPTIEFNVTSSSSCGYYVTLTQATGKG